jgi:DNA polymerase III delta prime subunit
MHAYFVITNSALTDSEAKNLVPDTKQVLRSKIEKIADARALIKETNVSLAKDTLYILEDFDKASTEAQNSFLKRLEEPQENISFLLTAKNESNILPTIISRCQKLHLKENSKKDETNYKEIKKFIESDTSGRIYAISKITKREDAVVFLENLISYLYDSLPENTELTSILKEADETLNKINKNANPTVQLTSFAISF